MARSVLAGGVLMLIFSMYFLCRHIQEYHSIQLQKWLQDQNSQELQPVLLDAGIWSKELLATTAIRVLPAQLLTDRRFVASYRSLKEQASNEVMLPLWLRDHQLQHYMALSKHQLHRLGYKTPGDIFQYIYDDNNLEQAQRHHLRSDVHRFKQAVREFMSAYQNNVAVITHKERYEQELSSWWWHLGPTAMAAYLEQQPGQLATTALLALICSSIVHRTLPATLPGHSSFLSALVLVWAMPSAGKFTIHIILLCRMLVDPVKTAINAMILNVWLQATDDFPDLEYRALFSVLPTLLFYLALHILSFQPLVTYCKEARDPQKPSLGMDRANGSPGQASKKCQLNGKDNNKKTLLETPVQQKPLNEASSSSDVAAAPQDLTQEPGGRPLDVVVTGIGCVDKSVKGFLRKQSLPWLYRKLLSLTIEKKFSWSCVERVKVDEVDVNWSSLRPLLLPSLQANHLHALWIINNRAFTDAEAGELADLLHQNTSLKHLKVAYDYEYSLLEHFYHLFLWDCVPGRFTSSGAQLLLDAIKENKMSNIKIMDFYGVKLEPGFIESARELKKHRPNLTIMGCKAEQVTQSLSSYLSVNRFVRGVCMLAVVAMSCYGIWECVINLREQPITPAWLTSLGTLFTT